MIDRPPAEPLRALGWSATHAPGLRLESAGLRGYHFGRAWSRTGTYQSVMEPGAVSMVLPEEGTGVIVHDGVETPYSPHDLIVLDGALGSTTELHEPTARYLWRFDASRFDRLSSLALFGVALPVRQGVWGSARGFTNSLIQGEPEAMLSPLTVRASENLLAAVLDSAASDLDRRSPEEVYPEALAVLAARRCDPAFTVTRLASELRVTARTLQRAFETGERTACEVLDRARAETLRARLGGVDRAEGEYARLAAASGFDSADQGRRAVARLLRGISKRR
ncbi:hypothetical protein GSU68_17960 [Rathayibacter sp. VKM Ac-2759]|uniref:hypothetical protein n=1 Tax=Rathayibacter sp. VKM Ac-2759 TaxID=2609252 RepID=UPI001317149A|nr:hypothetical protein [Rathayibacter sp. VKM Ac-2759]QHC68270.1 hypothetical protein GSU68_17960 [Rathayibacter sp. VKM Ac-2759]